MRVIWILLSIGIVTIVSAVIALPWFTDKGTIMLLPDNTEVVAAGKRIYDAKCASCHGKKLEGQANWRTPDKDGFLPAPPHDESGHTWHHADRLLFDLTKYGAQKVAGQDYKTRMPAYDRILSDEEIIAVLSYIKSRWPKNIRKRHDRINQAADNR